MYTIHFKMDSTLIREATWCFWKRYSGKPTIIAMAVFFMSLVMYVEHIYQPYILFILCLSGIMILLSGLVFHLYHRRGNALVKALEKPEITWQFQDDKITSDSCLGHSEQSWEKFIKVWCFTDVWLLFYSHHLYSILPTSAISRHAGQYIKEQIKNHGGKIE